MNIRIIEKWRIHWVYQINHSEARREDHTVYQQAQNGGSVNCL